MRSAIINLNGELIQPADVAKKARVSIFDRSYMYGDSLYEVARTYGGKLFRLRDHLERLESSAKLCRMVLGQPLSQYETECERTLQAFYAQGGSGEAYCRIIVSRGEGRIGFGLNCLTTPTLYTVIVQPLDEPTSEQLRKGYSMKISTRLRNDRRALDPAMKSGNYLNSLLAYLEAAAEDHDDALLCDHEGFLTEGTTFNLFYVRRGIVATPPLDVGILDGITRRILIQAARELGIEVREVRFPRERLYEADEVFLSSTIKEAFPITRVDGNVIGDGKPGPITMKLRKAFGQVVAREKVLA